MIAIIFHKMTCVFFSPALGRENGMKEAFEHCKCKKSFNRTWKAETLKLRRVYMEVLQLHVQKTEYVAGRSIQTDLLELAK